ncbi:MAG: hypothetical protein EP318_01145, partial [Rhodobacteraceae bacterium]
MGGRRPPQPKPTTGRDSRKTAAAILCSCFRGKQGARERGPAMATYIIVDKNKSPLEPDEIPAGATITVADGDVYIMDPSIAHDVTFDATSNPPVEFEVVFNDSNANIVKVNFTGDTVPSITVADDTSLPDVDLMGTNSSGMNLAAGDNVTLGKYFGSASGADNILIGDGFSTDQDWNTLGGDDTVRIGHDATLKHFKTGEGNDSLYFGDNLTGGDLATETGDDTVYLGKNADVSKVDGGSDTDSYTTASPDVGSSNMESTAVVCFAAGTRIATPAGPRAVETLGCGDLVVTLDHGAQKVLWVLQDEQPRQGVPREARPVLIRAGALGAGRPGCDLVVSPQHRVLVGGQGQLQAQFGTEVLVPAKALTGLPGTRAMMGKTRITRVHFAFAGHEIVEASGALSESVWLGPMALRAIAPPERRRLYGIYGTRAPRGAALNGPPARPCLTVGAVRRQLA